MYKNSSETKWPLVTHFILYGDDIVKQKMLTFIALCPVSSSIHKNTFVLKERLFQKLSFHVQYILISYGMRTTLDVSMLIAHIPLYAYSTHSFNFQVSWIEVSIFIVLMWVQGLGFVL